MATIGSYYVRVLPDMSGFNTPLVRTLGSTMGRAGDSAGRTFGNSFLGFVSRIAIGTTIGRLVTNGFNAVVGGFSTGIERLDIIENYPNIMSNLGIANEDAQRSVERLQEALLGLPTSLQGGVQATTRLTSALGDIDRSTEAFIAFNNALVAGMAPASQQASALEQFSQAVAKGRPDIIEWRAMLSAMPGQIMQIALSFGMTSDELGDALRAGDISMDEFLDAIIRLNEEGVGEFASFEEQARGATATIGTALTNVGNRIASGWAEIFKVFGQSNIAQFIDSVATGILNGFKAIAGAMQWLGDELASNGIIESFGTILTAVGELAASLAGDALTAVQGFVSDALEVFGAVLQAIADNMPAVTDALSGLFYAIGGVVETMLNVDFSPITDFLTGSGEQFAAMMERIQGHLDDLAPALSSLKETWDRFTETVARLVEAVAPFVVEFFSYIISAAVGLAPIVVRLVSWFLVFADVLLTIATAVGSVVIPFLTDLVTAIVGIVSIIIATVINFATNVISIAATIVGSVIAFFANLPEALLNIWNTIKNAAVTAWNNLKSSVTNTASTTASNVTSKFINLRTRVTEIWNNIKTAITEPINKAKEAVKNAIDKIKGFFNFSVSWPHIPLPHFGINPSGWVIGDLLKGVIPSLSISWYAKGGIINGATLYGVGEKGAELVWPSYEPYLSRYAAAITDNMDGAGVTHNYYIDGRMVEVNAKVAAALDTVAEYANTRARMGAAVRR